MTPHGQTKKTKTIIPRLRLEVSPLRLLAEEPARHGYGKQVQGIPEEWQTKADLLALPEREDDMRMLKRSDWHCAVCGRYMYRSQAIGGTKQAHRCSGCGRQDCICQPIKAVVYQK